MAKLDVKAFGLTLGIVWSLCVLIMGIFAMFGYCVPIVELIGSMYIGYKATIIGSIIGAVWGFFDAGIGGLIVAWIYNKLSK